MQIGNKNYIYYIIIINNKTCRNKFNKISLLDLKTELGKTMQKNTEENLKPKSYSMSIDRKS